MKNNGNNTGSIYRKYRDRCQTAGVSRECFYQRVHIYGWEPDRAATTPTRGKRPEKCGSEEIDNDVLIQRRQLRERPSEFVPDSPYISREYIRWCRYLLDLYNELSAASTLSASVLSEDSVENKMDELRDEIHKIEENPFWYEIIDLYLADRAEAERRYSETVIAGIRETLEIAGKTTDSFFHKVYFTFAAQYGLETYKMSEV